MASDEFLDMEDDGESTDRDDSSSPASSNEGSNEAAAETLLRDIPGQASLPVGLQHASYGAGSRSSRLDPLEIRFSQMKMRHLFGDGRRLADTVHQIKEERLTEAECDEYGEGVEWNLTFPFPKIEVIRWRCKLRDLRTGRPLLDKVTGEELYDSEEHWFTLDNRRLYSLQEAAMRVWPQRCVAEVAVIISGPHAHMRELRKFRTLDCGRSAKIGSRADGVVFVRWSWRQEVGLEEVNHDDSDGSEAECPPEVRVPHGRKPQKSKDQTVLEHLAMLKPDDYERIEWSKKISWILRHGAESSAQLSGRCQVKVRDDRFIVLQDMLQEASLKGLTLHRLLEVIADSNKQKYRYEMKESRDGTLIRASGRKGNRRDKTRDAPRDSTAVTGGKGSGGKAGGKGKDMDTKGNVGGAEKENGKLPEKIPSKPPGTLDFKDTGPATRPAARERSASTIAYDEQAVILLKMAAEARKAETSAMKTKMAVPKVPGFVDQSPQDAWMQNAMMRMQGARGSAGKKDAMMNAMMRGSRPPGPVAGGGQMPSLAAHMQFMQQMQMMQQMMQAGAMRNMEVRRLMQMRMMRQYQAMSAYQMQAMQAHTMNAQAMQYAQAMHEMQSVWQGWEEEGEEDEEDYCEEEEEEEEEYDDNKLPETQEELDARIQKVFSAASSRCKAKAEADAALKPKAASTSSAAARAGWRSEAKEEKLGDATADLESKIAAALQGAAARNGAKFAKAGEGLQPPPVAKATPARTPTVPFSAEMEAKIAEALEAAKNRGSDKAAKKAANASPKAEKPLKSRVLSKTGKGPKKTPEPDTNTNIQDKIAKVMEEAAKRNAEVAAASAAAAAAAAAAAK